MSSMNPSKGKSKFPLDQGTLNPIFNTANLALNTQKDTENDDAQALQGQAVIILDPTANPVKAFGLGNPQPINITQVGSVSVGSSGFLGTLSSVFDYGSLSYQLLRTPSTFKNITTLANGSTAIWTSAVGKKWRLMGICVTMLQGTTAAGACALKMLDVAADTGVGCTICIAAMTAVLNGYIILQGSFGNGILAAATNTALNVNLSSVLAVGGVSVQVWGTEE